MVERRLIEVEGLVQGVGFRPFVHALATRLDLRGSVRNDAGGVSIDVEGDRPALDAFVHALSSAPPPLASVERVRLADAAVAAYEDFRIVPSVRSESAEVGARVAPDVATCDSCVAELLDPANRRYRYAFLSCSQCGPRLTISCGAPYDRHRTTMRAFPMCEACRHEYTDPRDRRFHAQTIACAACGPTLALLGLTSDRLTGDVALHGAVAALADGAIVAVKGLGGFHLACDARNSAAVRRLRERKRRDAKPFAIMVRDVDQARLLCDVDDAEASLLASTQRPIVLLPKRAHDDATPGIAEEVAPGMQRLGVMLPYTPLHHLLLVDGGHPLVMTSGNASDEPIAYRDEDALTRLGDIADLFLTHDREIATRCDDSVVHVVSGTPSLVRRSRGLAPCPIPLNRGPSVPALGVGGHLKNTFCLTTGRSAFVSHHIGDLHNAEAYRALDDGIRHYAALFNARPEIIAHDLHPDYLSTQLAERLSAEERVERVGVQHHHAHILSCIAEHGVSEPVIGVAFDGTGMGLDGAIWGSELIMVEGARFERVAHLSYVPLPGGDAAVRHPWRAAVAHVWAAFDGDVTRAPGGFLEELDPVQLRLVVQMLPRPSLAPATSSMGRLFDAVAALIGIRPSAQFEAQAAMELESIADPSCTRGYSVDVRETSGGWTLDSGSFIRGVVADVAAGRPRAEIASAFHNAICHATTDVIDRIARRTGVRRVALSGGVFQNALLTSSLTATLSRQGFDVLAHRRVPCNDGGLSLGQAYAAILHACASRSPCA